MTKYEKLSALHESLTSITIDSMENQTTATENLLLSTDDELSLIFDQAHLSNRNNGYNHMSYNKHNHHSGVNDCNDDEDEDDRLTFNQRQQRQEEQRLELNHHTDNRIITEIDPDDTTMEVPLLNNQNNKDYERDHHQQHARIDEHNYQMETLCYCELPGFNGNLTNKSTKDAKFKILLAITLCCIFMIIEFLGGYVAGSLAIMTDAAHLASDCISFVIGLVAIWLGARPPDQRMSFGYKRMEVIGALVSIIGIWILTGTLVMVAIQRIYSNDFELRPDSMMIISAIGIIINIVMIFILHGSSIFHAHSHGHSHSHGYTDVLTTEISTDVGPTEVNSGNALKQQQQNGGIHDHHYHNHHQRDRNSVGNEQERNVNLRAAIIHVIGDLVQSIGVFLASVLIKFFPNLKFADPLCTLLFSVIVIMTTVNLFKESIRVIMDAVPNDIRLQELEIDLSNIEGVKSVHHLNVWSHTMDYKILMAHLVIDLCVDSNVVLKRATKLVCHNHKYNIKHCTIQIERALT